MLRAGLERVETKLKKAVRKPRDGTLKKIRLQAERTDWKIIYDEVDIKMRRTDLDQIEILKAFLPNVYDASKQQTFFDKIKTANFKLLAEQNEGE
jgi:vacuolar-type H+-ATPase subunit E/Vma4